MITVGQAMETLDRASGKKNTNRFMLYHLSDWKFGFPFESGTRNKISMRTKQMTVKRIVPIFYDDQEEPTFGSFAIIVKG